MLQTKRMAEKWMRAFSSIFLLGIFPLFAELDEGIKYSVKKTNFPPLIIHILEVDPAKTEMIIARSYDECIGREAVLTLAERHGALAAINGGFFRINKSIDGNPAGVLKIDQEWYSLGDHSRGAIGWDKKGNVIIDQIRVDCHLMVSNKSIPIQGINRPRSKEEKVIYTPSFHRTTLTSHESREVVIRNKKVAEIAFKGSAKIPSNGFVLSFDKKSNLVFEPQQEVDLKFNIQPKHSQAETWQDLDYIIGGAPVLIRNGLLIKDYAAEKLNLTFLNAWNARTAVGIKKDGTRVFVVVEGKKPWRSVGMTVMSLARLMLDLGCDQALNLDGGSSSTLVINGEQKNQTTFEGRSFKSCTKNVRISDAILIMKRE